MTKLSIHEIIESYKQKVALWNIDTIYGLNEKDCLEHLQIIEYLEELIKYRNHEIQKEIFHPKYTLYVSDEDRGDVIRYLGRFGNYKPSELGVNNAYICPKCEGQGTLFDQGNDGRDARQWVCEVCNGVGYTEKQMKPKMVQQGWEEVE